MSARGYREFLRAKRESVAPEGFEARDVNEMLFEWQRDIV